MSPRARAARAVQEEAVPHGARSSVSSEAPLLDYGCEEPVDLLVQGVQGVPRDVAAGEARPVADVLSFDEHEKICESCRRAGYSVKGKGLAPFTRATTAGRPLVWRALCEEGRRSVTACWTALGLGLPEYARESEL